MPVSEPICCGMDSLPFFLCRLESLPALVLSLCLLVITGLLSWEFSFAESERDITNVIVILNSFFFFPLELLVRKVLHNLRWISGSPGCVELRQGFTELIVLEHVDRMSSHWFFSCPTLRLFSPSFRIFPLP